MALSRVYRAVDADDATTGPHSTTIVQPIAKPAAALFRCLEDGPAWKEWLGIDVEWTSPLACGVGTTRTVKANGMAIDEVFTAYEPGRRMAFYFERAALPMKAFSEDYVIVETGPDSCELHWSYAYEWALPFGASVFGRVFRSNGEKALPKLAALMAGTDRFD